MLTLLIAICVSCLLLSTPSIISSFFGYGSVPGSPEKFNEIDIEFVRKPRTTKQSLQAMYYSNGERGVYHIIPLKFNPSTDFHNYAFKWTRSSITWYVNGVPQHTAYKNTPQAHVSPMKILMNAWVVHPSAGEWGGYFKYMAPRTAVYKAVRFTKGENCVVRNDL